MHVHVVHFPGSPLCLRFSGVGAHVKSFGRVIRATARPGERARIKNAKLWPEVGFVHVCVARLPGSQLSLRFSHAGAHVK